MKERENEPATFWEHLDVLRAEIIRMLLAAVLLAVVCFCLKDLLFEVVLAPSRSDFFIYRLLGADAFNIHLINTGLTEQMMVHLKVALVAGVMVACEADAGGIRDVSRGCRGELPVDLPADRAFPGYLSGEYGGGEHADGEFVCEYVADDVADDGCGL